MLFDETQSKIIDGAMELIMERGYAATTTKDIAKKAGVNECTIFRRFKGKKDIVLSAMQLPEWNPNLQKADFAVETGDLETDLCRFARVYMEKVTPRMVQVSMGLRSPELFPATAEGILTVPKLFKEVLTEYFTKQQQGALETKDIEGLAMSFLSLCFGFVFLKGSFGEALTELSADQYIAQMVKNFVSGIDKK